MTTTLKVKNGTIKLPKELQKAWKQAEVYVTGSRDMLTFKRITKPSLSLREMMDEFQATTKRTKLSKRDVEDAIGDVRNNASRH